MLDLDMTANSKVPLKYGQKCILYEPNYFCPALPPPPQHYIPCYP